MPLAAGAEQVGAPDEEVAREVLGVVRVLAGETQVAGLQLLQREVGDLLAGGLGSLADLERVGFELRRGGQPAHPLGAHVEVDHAAAPLGRIGQGRENVFDPQLLVLRSEEHTSELQSLMRISYAVFCLKKKK